MMEANDMNAHDDLWPDELSFLLGQLLGDNLTQRQCERLEALLAADLQAREAYVEFMQLHSMLHIRHIRPTDLSTESDNRHVASDDLIPGEESASGFQRVVSLFRNPTPLSLVIAAIVIGCMLVSLGITYLPKEERDVAQDKSPLVERQREVVASVLRLDQTVWPADTARLVAGQALRSGDSIQISKGQVRVEFESGATVLLAGPAELRLKGRNRAMLVSGDLNALVPDQAQGFTLETLATEIVDLGTEFSVSAETSGLTNVLVHEGVVKVALQTQRGLNRQWRTLRQGDSLAANVSEMIGPSQLAIQRFLRSHSSLPKHIVVQNPSFENPHLNLGEYGSPIGWQIKKRLGASSHNGCFHVVRSSQIGPRPHERHYDDLPPDGNQVGYANAGETLSQVLDERCRPGVEYALTVLVGRRLDGVKSSGYTVELLAGKQVIAADSNQQTRNLKKGSWVKVELSCEIDPDDSAVGQPLAIRLGSSVDRGNGHFNFDAVELTAKQLYQSAK